MGDCLFCKIIKGDIPCSKIAESENFLAFLDINPINEGHALIVPKKHSTNFLDMPEYLGTELIEFSQRIAQAIIASTGADGFNIGLNNGPSAGQVIFHTHFHVIPRNKDDGLKTWPGHQSDPEKLKELAGKISAAYK